MLQKGSQIKCADNSGARELNIINILGAKTKGFAKIGDIVIASVRGCQPKSNVKDHEVVRAIIVRTRKEIRRKDGSHIRFSDNAGVVVDAKNQPKATRVFGPIAREIRDKGHSKIASLAKEVY